MIDTSRIHYILPILGPAQCVHYTARDDLHFIQKWVTYLRAHERVPPTMRTTMIQPSDRDMGMGMDAAPRLVVTVHDGHSDRGDILRRGQSLILQDRQLTVLDTDTLHRRYRELGDPVAAYGLPYGIPAVPRVAR